MDDQHFDKMVSAMRGGPPRAEPRNRGPIVLFHTPWERPDDGWSVAARAYARAMEIGGIDVRLVTWHDNMDTDQKERDPLVQAEVGRFDRPPREWDVHVFSCFFGSAKRLVPVVNNLLQYNTGPQAYHCVFERQYIEPELVNALNMLHGVWAQCSANRDVLVDHGVKNVTLIHQPYFDEDPHLQIPPPKSCRRFYWIGRFEPRKAPDNLIRAFMRAFKPGEASLTLKLSAYQHSKYYVSPESVLLEELVRPEIERAGWTLHNWKDHIHLIRGRISHEEIVNLHAQNDVYVSASRGEGLDLPAFAAKLAGRQLLLTDSGGPRDFINDGDVLIPARGVIEAPESYQWGKGANYADYSLEKLIVAMQQVRGTQPKGSRVPEMFRAEKVGAVFSTWIDSLRRMG